jgi:glycosyltransferase involved in cell wall biosynthesis
MKVIILMPCLDDLATAVELVVEVSTHLAVLGHHSTFLLVDDGSCPHLGNGLLEALPNPPAEVHMLRLSRNLGHQRAIACGLCHLGANPMEGDVVVVMDSDGEDRPEDVPRLVEEWRKLDTPNCVVFAERRRRTEGIVFRSGYHAYLNLHHLLIGQAPRVGNFSALSAGLIPALTSDPDLWSHYAATVWKSRIRRLRVPVARGTRRRGRSRLNLAALVLHGLAAISCYRETLVLRMVLGSALLLAGTVAVFALALKEWPIHDRAYLSPLVVVAAVFFCTVLQFFLMTLWQCFNVLQNRHQATFIPARDYLYFVPGEALVLSPHAGQTSQRPAQAARHE